MKRRRHIPDWASERGYVPQPLDDLPMEPVDESDPWMVALRESTEEARRLRAEQP
jgi:hypothetical protein